MIKRLVEQYHCNPEVGTMMVLLHCMWLVSGTGLLLYSFCCLLEELTHGVRMLRIQVYNIKTAALAGLLLAAGQTR